MMNDEKRAVDNSQIMIIMCLHRKGVATISDCIKSNTLQFTRFRCCINEQHLWVTFLQFYFIFSWNFSLHNATALMQLSKCDGIELLPKTPLVNAIHVMMQQLCNVTATPESWSRKSRVELMVSKS